MTINRVKKLIRMTISAAKLFRRVTAASKGTVELMQTVLYHLMNLVTWINNGLFG